MRACTFICVLLRRWAHDAVDPKKALKETLAREAELKSQMGKANSRLASLQSLNAKMADELRAANARVALLEAKAKEDVAAMRPLQNQASQAFKLADQVRKSTETIARQTEQLKEKDTAIAALTAAAKTGKGDAVSETSTIKKLQADCTRLQAEISQLKQTSAASSAPAATAPALPVSAATVTYVRIDWCDCACLACPL